MDRRSQYRIGLEEGDSLETVLLESGGWMVCGRIADFSALGAGVRVTRFTAPVPGVGDDVRLRFPSALFNEPLSVTARVVHRTGRPGSLFFGLRFLDQSEIEARLWPALHRYFNRRRSPRVETSGDVEVRITADGAVADVTPLDVSETGLGLRVPMEVEWAHKDTDRITFSMSLPPTRYLFNLEASIRTRRLQPDAKIRYGLELDLAVTDPRRRAIADYVGVRSAPIAAAA